MNNGSLLLILSSEINVVGKKLVQLATQIVVKVAFLEREFTPRAGEMAQQLKSTDCSCRSSGSILSAHMAANN